MKRIQGNRDSTRVLLLKQITGYDPAIVAMLLEGAEELSKTGGFVYVLSDEDYDEKRGFVHVFGTYHRVAENEWGSTRFLKHTRFIEDLGGIDEE